MRIRKALITMESFMKPFKLKYKVRNYTPDIDKNDPLICFGCYTKTVMHWIVAHKGLCVIVWSGSDSMGLKGQTWFVNYCKENKDRIRHIAHSHWIQSDLKAVGLEYIDKVVFPVTFDWLRFEPTKGSNLYHYHVRDKNRYSFYGTDLVNDLEKRKKLPFIKTAFGHVELYSDDLYKLYASCHTGVRLTTHDNMSLSCVEMGLMGRRSIFNGNIPGAIPFADRAEATRVILEAHINKPEPDRLLSEEMREFVYDDEKWLNTEYYD
jgi:hypothetical protein